MSRFYKTEKGTDNFNTDFTYRPPWELAKDALATQQQGYDEMLASSQLFDSLNIQHIGTEEEKEVVGNIVQSYTDRADSIANSMQNDKMNWRKYSGELRGLQRDLQRDITTGNISKIQSNYAAMQDYMKRYEDLRKDDPMRYQAAMADAMSRFNNTLAGDTWSQQDILKGPDYEALLKEIDELKSNKTGRVRKNPNGRGYLIDNSYEVEEVTPERIVQYATSRLMSDPNTMAWARQTQDWKLGSGFFNEDGTPINALEEVEYTTKDENGNDVVRTRLGINPNSGFSPFLHSAIGKAFSKVSESEKWSADATYNSAANRQNSMNIAKMNNEHSWNRDLLRYQHEGNMKALDMEFKKQLAEAAKDREAAVEIDKYKRELEYKAAGGDKAAQQMLNQLNATSLVFTEKTPELSVDTMKDNAKMGIPRFEQAVILANDYSLSKNQGKFGTKVGKDLAINLLNDAMEAGLTEEEAMYNVAIESLGMQGVYLQGETQEIMRSKIVGGRNAVELEETTFEDFLARPYDYPDETSPEEWVKVRNQLNVLEREKEVYDQGVQDYVDEVYNKAQTQSVASSLNIQGISEVKDILMNYKQNLKYIDLSDTDKAVAPLDFDSNTIGEEYDIKGMTTNTIYGSVGIILEAKSEDGVDANRFVVYPDGSDDLSSKLTNAFYNIGAKYSNSEEAKEEVASAEIIKLGKILSTPAAPGQTIRETIPVSSGNVDTTLNVSKKGNVIMVTSEYLPEPMYPRNAYEVYQIKKLMVDRLGTNYATKLERGKNLVKTFNVNNPSENVNFANPVDNSKSFTDKAVEGLRNTKL